jgi:hypothetical protein
VLAKKTPLGGNEEKKMKIKTNIRAGQGGSTTTSVDTSTSTGGSVSSGGANSGGVNSNKPTNTIVYYTGTASRCVGL